MSVPAPANIEFLALAAGDDVTLAFIEQMGGQEIFIPINPAGSRLETLFGVEIASALSGSYPKEMWRVPMCRDWRIRRYLAMGLTINQIAARAGVTADSVYKSLRKPYRGQMAKRPPRPHFIDHRQADLF